MLLTVNPGIGQYVIYEPGEIYLVVVVTETAYMEGEVAMLVVLYVRV